MEFDRMGLVQVLRSAHIAAGAVALVSLWIPIVARKGGALHRRVGWVYAYSMGAIAFSAVVLCAERLLYEPPARRSAAVLLAFVALFSFNSLLAGLRVLRRKDRVSPSRSVVELLPPALVLGSAVAVSAAGLVWRQPLLVAFPILGMVNGVSQLRYWLRRPQEKMHWFFEHIGQMGTSCIATITAFFVVNASHFGLGTSSFVLWFTPGAIGLGLIFGAVRYYQRRFASVPGLGQVSGNVQVGSRKPARSYG